MDTQTPTKSRKELLNHRVYLRLKESDWATIDEMAQEREIDRSVMMRLILIPTIKKHRELKEAKTNGPAPQ